MESRRHPTIFHIDIDAFFASVEEALCPALRGKPVIVGGLPNDRGVVSCPNYEARKLGVKTAMPLSKAYSLAPNAMFVRGSYKSYEKYSRRFMEVLNDFSPLVQAVSLDEAFLDADGCLHFWNGDPRVMANAIKRAVFEELKITVSIGVASNKLCAKVASDYSKKLARESAGGKILPPDGLLIVGAGREKEFLSPLPVSAIPGIGKRTAAALQDLGIRSVRDLAQSSPDLLRKIFGVVGTYLHNAANGIGASALATGRREPRSISRGTTFGQDSNDENFITSVIFYLSEKVAHALRKEGATASTVVFKLRYSDGAPLNGYRTPGANADRRFVTYQKNSTLEEPTDSEFEIAAAAFSLFKKLWLQGVKVRLVGVGVMNVSGKCDQLNLFDSLKTKRSNLLKGIDSIRDKFGYNSIYFGMIDRLGTDYDIRHRADMQTENGIAEHPFNGMDAVDLRQ
ncbi:MAG: DNA polymerase IV [Bacteroidetes bacterium]|jgi:DNA polymerase-4|nr:DNA polymerase IV [Bacteroidota bacterium]MCL5034624.1 DNA polymerase IV [Bacteroidota bacterium]